MQIVFTCIFLYMYRLLPSCEMFKASTDNFNIRNVIGKYVRVDYVAHHHQQVEVFSKKPQFHCSSVINVFPTAVLWDSAFPTQLCYLFTFNGMGKMDGRDNLARLRFGLSSNTALQLGQEDFFRSNGRHMDSCLYIHYSPFILWLMLAIIILRHY